MDLELGDKLAAVAASSSGLGFACALALAREGASVALCGRSAERLDQAVASLTEQGHRAMGFATDLSDPAGADGFVEAVSSRLGPIDILVANSGGPPQGGFNTVDVDAYRAALEQNLLSSVALCKAVVPGMCERNWGRVVAITSVTARQPIADLILSNVTRAGLTGFLKTLAMEVVDHGVTVNSVQPGPHGTDRLVQLYGEAYDPSQARVGDPNDLGAAVAFLCSERARFITGVGLPIDGGAYQGLQ